MSDTDEARPYKIWKNCNKAIKFVTFKEIP